MEEISTLHTGCPESFEVHTLSAGVYEANRSHELTRHIPARVISYLWKLIYGRFSAFGAVIFPQTTLSSLVQSEQGLEGMAKDETTLNGFPQDPPDIPDSGPPFSSLHTLIKACHFFTQRPMNEKLIRSKFPHKPAQQLPDGRGIVITKTESIRSRSYQQLLFPTESPFLVRAMSAISLFVFWLMVGAGQAQAQSTINLSLHKNISTQSPALGDVLTYTVVVANATGSATATNIVIQDDLPVGGVAFVPGSVSIVRGTGTYTTTGSATATTGTWTIPSLAPGDSSVLVLQATVLQRGVWFNKAEVVSVDQTDSNSIPNNHSLVEDDYVTVCFSVPMYWYVGDEFTVTVPSGYNQIVWYRNNVPISSSTVSTSIAEVNADSSLTIKSLGTYRFVTYSNSCPSTNCCDIQVIQGPYGSLGDYVFIDANKNGAQDTGDSGLNGVKVYLYDLAGTTRLDSTVTTGGGKYLFDSLTDGSYIVKFISPTGYQSTSANAAGVPDNLDSDAGTNGFTGIYTVDTSQPESSTARNNLTVDAGFYLPSASLGDYIFVDANKNGIQDGGDSPLPGVVVALLDGNNLLVATTTSNASGLYSFTGLTPGVPYSVSFVSPTGYTSTSAQVGGDDTKDSDANPTTGQTRSVTLAPGENNPNLDAGFQLSCPTDYSLIVSNDVRICTGDSTKLIASTQLQHAKICYFLTPTGGAPFAIVDSGDPVTVKPTTTTTYYVEVTLNGCESPRTPISVTVTTVPTPMAPTLVKNTCPVKTVDLTTVQISNQTSGLIYEWYTSASRSANTQVTNLTAVGAGQYYLFAKSGDCYSNSTVVTVETVNCVSCPTDYSLIVSNDATICNGDSTGLVASTAVPKAKISWFLTPYGGTPFAIVDSGDLVSVKPTTTTVYYVEVTVDSCKSPRKPVVVTVTTVPTPICLGNIKNTCPATTVNLTSIQIENRSTGLTYEWYTSLNRSVATQVTNLTTVGAGKYYLFAKSGNCYSNPTVLTVEITDCNCTNVAGVTVGPGVAVCAGDMVSLKAVLSGSATSVVWASNGTGTFSSPTSLTTTYTPSASDVATGNVQLTATTNDPDGPGGVCQSATSTLIAQINKRPDAPVNVACDDTLVCQGSSTKLIGFAPGARINWYDQDGTLIGTTQSGGKLVVTPAKSGAVVYFAQAFTDAGCTSARTSLTITVGSCLADLAIVKQIQTPGPYNIGQKVTYALTVSNNGSAPATGVQVSELLPASLTYVSSTPVGQYNPATGIWTVGALNVGSDRSLLIEATIVATGSIKNTAIVSGSNNDPKKPQNDSSSVTIPVNPCPLVAHH